MLTSPQIHKVETHMIYRKIALYHIYLVIYIYITAYYKIGYRDITLNAKFLNFHIKFLNSDFLVSNALNAPKFLGDTLCSPLEGRSLSQNFDLGPG